jgi:uncharacterized protein
MHDSWVNGLVGGVLIGLGSLLAMVATGKVPGVSGVFGRLLRSTTTDRSWRIVFLIGIIAGGAISFALYEPATEYRLPEGRSLLVIAVAGLLVGFGTRLGGGCTSGHGVCGMGMGAKDSIVATMVFMAAGFVTVVLWNMLTTG